VIIDHRSGSLILEAAHVLSGSSTPVLSNYPARGHGMRVSDLIIVLSGPPFFRFVDETGHFSLRSGQSNFNPLMRLY
jgi:hypothetical protein